MYTCKRCSAPISAGAKFCLNCGSAVEVDLDINTPVASTSAPATALSQNAVIANVKKYMHFIIVGLAGLALIVGILNLFGWYNATAVASGYGQRQTASGPVRDLYTDKPLVLFANLIYGIISMVIAFIGGSHYLKSTMGNDMYDKYVGKFANNKLRKFVAGDGVLTLMGVLGAVNVIFQWLLYLFTRESGWGVSAWVRIHWTSWVMLFVYLAAAGCDIFLLNKKEK